MGILGSIFNVSTISTVLIVAWLWLAAKNIYQQMNPLYGVEIKGPTIDPLWSANKEFNVFCFLSSNSRFKAVKLSELRSNDQILFEKHHLRYNVTQASMTVELSINDASTESTCKVGGTCSSSDVVVKNVASRFWKQIKSNKTDVFLHVVMISSDNMDDQINHTAISSGKALYGHVRMIKYDKIPKSYRQRYLLSDFGWVDTSAQEAERIQMPPESIISYWKPEVAVKIVTDFSRYPYDHVPMGIGRNIVDAKRGDQSRFYKPSVFVDEIGLTSDKYVPLNASLHTLPLTISFAPMSLQRWLLMDQMEQVTLLSPLPPPLNSLLYLLPPSLLSPTPS